MLIILRLESTDARYLAVVERLPVGDSRNLDASAAVDELGGGDHVDGLSTAFAAAVVLDGGGCGAALCGCCRGDEAC